MNNLQKALRNNALFSIISGVLMIVLNRQLASLFGTSNNTIFWSIGLVLLYFAITIWLEIKKQRRTAIIWIIIQDYAWVLGSSIILITKPFQITSTGNLIIGIIALIVLFMGIHQTIELKKFKNKTE
ncbi:hypothetical protein [Tenacibaculum sp. 190524A05c]|uniref:SPW repeat-containing protein n=1 Tax=Tenacibaculum platacis TaxID=3137852 RepID=A0ABM9P2R0_9FLAO